MLQIVVTIAVVALAFWTRDKFLYIIAGPSAIISGFSLSDMIQTPAGMTLSLAIAAIGFYCIIIAIMKLLGKWE